MNIMIGALRREYRRRALSETDVATEPLLQFRIWFEEAIAAEATDANAMTLATVGADGKPSARIVLLKDIDDRGLSFFTSYRSKKAADLEHNPHAALGFWWPELERQVQFCGPAERVSAAQADAYFSSRPRGSQIGAWASAQSSVIPGRDLLEQRIRELEEAYEGKTIPRPDYWGGYLVRPESVEFWQGRPSRLHDRIRYLRSQDQTWKIDRLSP